MVTITLYTRQQKRLWCIEQSFGFCGRGTGWDDLGEWHWNMYNITYETSCQSRFDARYWMLGAGALGRPRGMVWGGRREEGSGWGTRVYLWRIHVDIWQNQYNIVKLKKLKKNRNVCILSLAACPWAHNPWFPHFYFSLILFFNFKILYCFAIYQHESATGTYTCSPSWTLLPPPSPYHPSGSSQCTSPKIF